MYCLIIWLCSYKFHYRIEERYSCCSSYSITISWTKIGRQKRRSTCNYICRRWALASIYWSILRHSSIFYEVIFHVEYKSIPKLSKCMQKLNQVIKSSQNKNPNFCKSFCHRCAPSSEKNTQYSIFLTCLRTFETT